MILAMSYAPEKVLPNAITYSYTSSVELMQWWVTFLLNSGCNGCVSGYKAR